MSVKRIGGTVTFVWIVLAIGMLMSAVCAQAALEAPVKEISKIYLGWEVDQTTQGKLCVEKPGNKCQPAASSSEVGGFRFPEAAASAPGGNFYIADRGNARVQEFTPDGTFVLMFGREVNKKGGDICTASEEAECQAGLEGFAPGQLSEGLQSIAVDRTSGNVYVAESPAGLSRVQEFTPTGQFVLEIGHEVNETNDGKAGSTPEERNRCTAEEVSKGVKCKAPSAYTGPEPGAFNLVQGVRDMLEVGGPEDVLYVGDEHRVQEFDSTSGPKNGGFKGEISLVAVSSAPGVAVTSVALKSTGAVYVVYGADPKLIREFDASGTQIATFAVGAVLAMAVDTHERLAVSENAAGTPRGSLYDDVEDKVTGVRALHVNTRFVSHDVSNLAFSGDDEMFAVVPGGTSLEPLVKQEAIVWTPVPVAELGVEKGTVCVPGPDNESNATLNCKLLGFVNPWGVPKTVAWVDWGSTPALGTETPKQSIATGEAPVELSASIEDVIPGETFYYELRAEDAHVESPEEPLTSPSVEIFETPSVPPRVVGTLTAGFQTATSSVLFGKVNPENTSTKYMFQYAPETDCDHVKLSEGNNLTQACSGVRQTGETESSLYGSVGVAMQAVGLQPATEYRYRLYAVNINGQGVVNEMAGPILPEGTFKTRLAPAVSAVTGDAGSITTTSAVVTGDVNPDGQQSVYSFELGIDEGATTHFAKVFSGSAGAGTVPVSEEFLVSALQPGTTYAYRIAVHFGDGTTIGSSAIGESHTFRTLGVAETLTTPIYPGLLGVPVVIFPVELKLPQKCKRGYVRKRGKCVRNKVAGKKAGHSHRHGSSGTDKKRKNAKRHR
jgi:hypothetical protein